MPQQAPSRTRDVVTSIWQHVLQRPMVHACDNFFEIGGTADLAKALTYEIERRLGRTISPVMIYHLPTIASLTTALEDRSFPEIPPVTLLKPGQPCAPLFLAHGVGDTVLSFCGLVAQLGSERPIYGLQAKGSDGRCTPLDRIEDMAEFHLAAIRQVQSRGPYFLVGHSFGGLVILEIARRIMHEGDIPGVVVMIDSYPHLRHLAQSQKVRLIARLATRRVFGTKTHPTIIGVKDKEAKKEELALPMNLNAAMLRVRECGYLALKRYRPRFYNGKIHFVRAEIISIFPDDPAAVWSQLAKDFELETMPGDHMSMLTTHFDKLADILTRYALELDN